jgi:hypothetical protein
MAYLDDDDDDDIELCGLLRVPSTRNRFNLDSNKHGAVIAISGE